MEYYPNQKADIEAVIKNEKPSKSPMRNYSYCEDFFSFNSEVGKCIVPATIRFIDCEELKYGEEAKAEIWFSIPGIHTFCLEVGQIISLVDEEKVYGQATITKINNKLLDNQMKNNVIPEHLQNLVNINYIMKSLMQMNVKCTCGHHHFYLFTNTQNWNKNNEIIKENDELYLKQRSLFGMVKKIDVSDKAFETKARKIIKVKCAHCGKEHVLFDNFKHGYKAITNQLEKHIKTQDQFIKFKQCETKAKRIIVEITPCVPYSEFFEKLDSFESKADANLFVKVSISTLGKNSKKFIEKTN